MGYCPFSNSGRDTTGLYCDKQGAGAPGHDTAWPACWGARSGRDMARSGRDMARSGCDMARSGRDMARSGRDMARSGRDMARSGRDMARSGHDMDFVSRHDFCVATGDSVREATRRCDTEPKAERHGAQCASTWRPACCYTAPSALRHGAQRAAT